MAQPNVKFKRIIKVGTTGDDVKAIKIIASRAGCWPWQEFDKVAHEKFMHGYGKNSGTSGLRGLQKALGVSVDGIYGPATHSQSLPYRVPKGKVHAGEYIWGGHAQALYAKATMPQIESKAAGIVKEIFNWWSWMVARQGQIHYSQVRPMRELSRRHEPPVLPFYEDCSSTFIYCAFLGGAKSPDIAYGFSGYGNTDSLVRCGIPISEADIPKYCQNYYVGVYYGSSIWNTHHICAVKSPTQVYSMGNEYAPEVKDSIHDWGQIAAIKAHAVL